jgi:hypothetical protein
MAGSGDKSGTLIFGHKIRHYRPTNDFLNSGRSLSMDDSNAAAQTENILTEKELQYILN